jgi:hypothetical protein
VPITDQLFRLGRAARRLNDGSDRIDRSLVEIDRALGRLLLGFEYQLPRPIAELGHTDRAGKRVIEVSYLGYLRLAPVQEGGESSYHLAVRTLKVLEDKRAADEEAPGRVVPLIEAPRAVRHAAVDHLPELVAGLAAAVDDMVENIERRCAVASSVLDNLSVGGSHEHE